MLFAIQANATDIIFNSRSASALNKVILYPDSSFLQHSNVSFNEGSLFELLGESQLEHPDDAQNQKFKWYKVKATDGQEGWIFGDGLAVISADHLIDSRLKKYHKKRYSFDNGFEKAITWIASISGRDNFHENDMLNPPYNEFYLVITNERGKSVHINFAGLSAMGKNELHDLKMTDVTGDNVAELILQRNSYPMSSDLENRLLEVYSFQAGTLTKVFEERMTLNYEDDMPSPALSKHIEIADKSIRVEYIDYMPCKSYRLKYPTDLRSRTKERCIEYVTYTYIWDDKLNHYRPLYEESRTTPIAFIKRDGLSLKSKPALSGKYVSFLSTANPLQVIKHYEKIVVQQGKKKIENYLYVRDEEGTQGYILAKDVRFVGTEHLSLIHI